MLSRNFTANTSERGREALRKEGVCEKNEASKIKYVRFTLNDVIEENKHIRRSLEVEICADALPNELINELNDLLTREFPSLNAFVKLYCEYA